MHESYRLIDLAKGIKLMASDSCSDA